jgi:hypothetical protein
VSMQWGHWHNNAAQRSERARRAAMARWSRAHDDSDAPMRETRTIEVTLRDSHRPMETIRLSRDDVGDGRWSRWRVEGARIRPLGATGVARLLARLIE